MFPLKGFYRACYIIVWGRFLLSLFHGVTMLFLTYMNNSEEELVWLSSSVSPVVVYCCLHLRLLLLGRTCLFLVLVLLLLLAVCIHLLHGCFCCVLHPLSSWILPRSWMSHRMIRMRMRSRSHFCFFVGGVIFAFGSLPGMHHISWWLWWLACLVVCYGQAGHSQIFPGRTDRCQLNIVIW